MKHLLREPLAPVCAESAHRASIELGLTEQQKEQIVPIMTQELAQLEALKKNTSLSTVQKVEQLRQLSRSSDEKITLPLNSEQQPKFQAMREQMRRQIIEKMGSQAAEKVEADIMQKLGEPPVGEKCPGLRGPRRARGERDW